MEMGLQTTGDLWSAKALIDNKFHPMVLKMHKDFINAGSEVIVTSNFSVRRRLLVKYNLLESIESAIKSNVFDEIYINSESEKFKKIALLKFFLEDRAPYQIIIYNKYYYHIIYHHHNMM